jgi:hypothetical protein
MAVGNSQDQPATAARRGVCIELALVGRELPAITLESTDGAVGLDEQLAATLALPTFSAGDRTFYRRLALVVENGLIARVFHPVAEPEQNAADVVAWLESRLREKGPRSR